MMAALQFDNVSHPWLWLLAVVAGGALLAVIYRDIYLRTERRLTWWLLGLRGVGLVALVLALAKPTWVRRSETVEPGRLAVVVDNSVSMTLPAAGGQARYALAREAVAQLQRGLGDRVVVDLFDINGEPLPRGLPAEPQVARTDLGRAIGQTLAKLRSQPLAAVVLVSDGMDNTGRQGTLLAEDAPVPIHGLGFRDWETESPYDLAVSRVQAPARVIVNNTVKVTVPVQKTGGPATTATVTVKRGSEVFASQTVTLPAGATEQVVSVNITPTEGGSFVFTATVIGEASEKVLANNTRTFPLTVDAEAIRVFYVEGFLRYEYKFVKNRFEDDPDVSLVSVVRRANPERDPSASGGELITAERLRNFEVVILGDMEGDYLSRAEYQALAEWVNEGHALLVLGGYRSFGPTGFRGTPLADVLPVVLADAEPYQTEEAFVLELTEAGERHPIFELAGDRVRDAEQWRSAPALAGASLIKRIKPGAEVLAVNPSFQSAPVVVVHRYGAGRVLVLAVDTTWRWSRMTRVVGQADTLFARFWSQTIRWLAGRDPERKRLPVTVSTDQPDYAVGQPVTIRVERAPDTKGELTVTVAPVDGPPVPVRMQANSATPDVFTGTVYPSGGGRYAVSASLSEAGKLVANETAEFLVQGADWELADTRTNRGVLQSVAAATGGVYYDVESAAELAGKIEGKERRTVQVQRTEYWNSPWLFLVFLGAVSAEWVLRRRNHLV